MEVVHLLRSAESSFRSSLSLDSDGCASQSSEGRGDDVVGWVVPSPDEVDTNVRLFCTAGLVPETAVVRWSTGWVGGGGFSFGAWVGGGGFSFGAWVRVTGFPFLSYPYSGVGDLETGID